jgi:hemerythrin-like domain-containing protein
MKHQPIRRSKHIMALSKDHHSGLLFCWKVKEGIKRSVALPRITNYINFFWENHLRKHFAEEETLLFDVINDELTQQAKNEHGVLSHKINDIVRSASSHANDYAALTELLTQHIRFEERVLFPHLEAKLSPDILVKAGEYLDQHHQVPFNDDFQDQFWTKDA